MSDDHPFAGLRVPKGGFKTILADPPWKYECRSAKGEKKSPQRHYSCMTIEEIAGLPVGDIAADDAVLFMWITWPFLLSEQQLPFPVPLGNVHAPQNVINYILKAWGFYYVSLAWEWDKKNPDTGKRSFGGGYYTRKNLEPCIIARRGSPGLPKSRSVTDLITAPRGLHSQKPAEQYERIEAMYDGPYLELFAVDKRRGWKQWNPMRHR